MYVNEKRKEKKKVKARNYEASLRKKCRALFASVKGPFDCEYDRKNWKKERIEYG